MPWIEVLEANEANETLASVYRDLGIKPGNVSNILKVQSLNPKALRDHLNLYATIMLARSGLSRAEREAVGVVVSAVNDCEYCVEHHVDALERYEDDEATIDTLRAADGLETLEPRLAAIARHANKLTSAPSAVTESDTEELRVVGLDDSDILDLTLTIGYFNFVNRLALGLGVELSDASNTGDLNE